MNFELKALTAAAAAREKCDLLLVLVSEQAAPGTLGSDAIGALVAHAVKQGDFALSAGKQLPLYQVPAIAAACSISERKMCPRCGITSG